MPKLDREAPNQYASRSQLNQTVNAKSKKSKAIRCDCRTDRDRSFNHPATGASRNVGSPVYDLVGGFSQLPAGPFSVSPMGVSVRRAIGNCARRSRGVSVRAGGCS
jgi:hypothetical protein